jgi:acyl-CoA synthetase (AMP-forming)/AMP-acid ligase II
MIEVRSAAMMLGYLGDDTDSPIRADGWLVTGDLGSLDHQGRIRLLGRRSEMYVRGGYNVHPLEVEQVLAEHPGVSEAAVVSVEDEVLGALGVAFVVPLADSSQPSLEDLRLWCKEQLADYKAPDRLVVLSRLPRNQMGKVDKPVLAAHASRLA